MRQTEIFLAGFLLFVGLGLSVGAAHQRAASSGTDSVQEELITLERSALDRWIRLDPEGYLALYDSQITYFDPYAEKRVDGLEALQARFAPMKSMKLPFRDPRYEIVNPKVQRLGDVAVLTFQLVNYGKLPDQPESVIAHWNSTEIYSHVHGKWRIVHSHWSRVAPGARQAEL